MRTYVKNLLLFSSNIFKRQRVYNYSNEQQSEKHIRAVQLKMPLGTALTCSVFASACTSIQAVRAKSGHTRLDGVWYFLGLRSIQQRVSIGETVAATNTQQHTKITTMSQRKKVKITTARPVLCTNSGTTCINAFDGIETKRSAINHCLTTPVIDQLIDLILIGQCWTSRVYLGIKSDKAENAVKPRDQRRTAPDTGDLTGQVFVLRLEENRSLLPSIYCIRNLVACLPYIVADK